MGFNPITRKPIKEVKIDPNGCTVIPNWVVTHLGLKGLKKEVYSIIYNFTSGENKWTFCSAQYLAKLTGSSEAGVFKALKDLLDDDLINKQSEEVCGAVVKTYYQYNSNKVNNDYKKSSGDNKKSYQLKSNLNTSKEAFKDNKRIKSNTSGEVYTHSSSSDNFSFFSKNNDTDILVKINDYIEQTGLNTSLENAWQCHRCLEYIKGKTESGERIYDWEKLLLTFIEKNQDRIIPLEPNTLDKIRFLKNWYLKYPNENNHKQKLRLQYLEQREQAMISGLYQPLINEDNVLEEYSTEDEIAVL